QRPRSLKPFLFEWHLSMGNCWQTVLCETALWAGQSQGPRVDAVAQAGRRRAVLEHVTQVGITPAAKHFGSRHPETRVAIQFNAPLVERRPEAGPAAPGLHL